MVRVKICGITNVEDAALAVQCGADALGFVFARSARRVTPGQAREICATLPPFVAKVGVFVDEDVGVVKEIVALCSLDAVQFHGSEPPDFCVAMDCCVIKAFRVRDMSVTEDVARYRVRALLLDAYSPSKAGGTGETFDWDIAAEVARLGVPVILAGGLTPGNVASAIARVAPYAVDVSSGVERAPGSKDGELLRAFIWNAKKAAAR